MAHLVLTSAVALLQKGARELLSIGICRPRQFEALEACGEGVGQVHATKTWYRFYVRGFGPVIEVRQALPPTCVCVCLCRVPQV